MIILSFATISNATDESNFAIPEKSQEFEEWEKLSEEEKANTVQPSYSTIRIQESVKKSKYNDIISSKQGNSLASNYRINGLTVKDQQKSGLCWAFSFSSMLEGTGNKKVYSPAYLDYVVCNRYNKRQGDGANARIALSSSASGKYPVLEKNMPFNSVYDETKNDKSTFYLTPINQLPEGTLKKPIDARITDATYFASIDKKVDVNGKVTCINTSDEVTATRTLIKEHIQNNGPITATIYMDIGMDAQGNILSPEGYFNNDTGAFFCNNSGKLANHAVTIVGWDDHYAVTNFNEKNRPTNSGAYIVLNSYGEEVGDQGYIYVSYEDFFIEQDMVGIDQLEEYETEEDITYETMYQYDELGANLEIFLAKNDSESLLAANIFTRDQSKTEYLTEVGIALLATQGIEVYVNNVDSDLTHLRQVAVETDHITPGYHIIKLSSPVKLKGDQFAVVVKYTNKQDGSRIPIEANWKDSGISSASSFYDTAKSNEKESYVSLDGGKTWSDLYNYKLSKDVTLKNTNTCIKAYTVESAIINVSGITLNQTNLSMEIGDTKNLIATIDPEDTTNQNVTWSSSNPKVATISDTGIITAIGEGDTTITVTTEDGNYSATCKVTVQAKTNTDDDIYKDPDNKPGIGNTNISGTTNTVDKTNADSTTKNENGITNKNDSRSVNTIPADHTVATKSIPYAGNNLLIIIAIVLIIFVGGIVSIRFRILKDVK